MFYHARVTSKSERAKERESTAFEFDLPVEELLNKIAVPFVERTEFYCGGAVVNPSKVSEVRFVKTQQNSAELAPFIEARRRASGVLVLSPPEHGVFGEGKDVTREILDEAQKLANKGDSAKSVGKSARVFIVHGHDQAALDQTEILIRRFQLTPIILRDAPSAGRTVIEKFEAHSVVGAAIVLLTPDDYGGVDSEHLQARARQNVIWEWGYLVAKLGRQNVICLYKGGVEVPSDLHGLITIHVGEDVRQKAEEIRRELIAAGYEIL